MADQPTDIPPTGLPSQQVTDDLFRSLTQLLLTGTDPGFLESQRIMMRRLALQGDVAKSRIPAPQNITEVGGYLNLLEESNETTLKSQMLAGALGVAGPDVTDYFIAEPDAGPGSSFTSIPNSRPQGAVDGMIPNTILIRQDLLYGVQRLVSDIQLKGGALPLVTDRVMPGPIRSIVVDQTKPPYRVPSGPLFKAIGREIRVPQGILFKDPAADIIAVGRQTQAPGAVGLLVRISSGTASNWDLVKVDMATGKASTQCVKGKFIAISDLAARYGWHLKRDANLPTTLEQALQYTTMWSDEHLTSCITTTSGLQGVQNATTLGEELQTVYSKRDIASWPNVVATDFVWSRDDMSFVSSDM